MKIDHGVSKGVHAAYGAAQNDNLQVLKLLIQKDPNVADLKGWEGRTPLVAAARLGHLDIAEYLTSLQKVNINSQENDGSTALIWAAYNNHPKVVQFLLQKGADFS